MSEKNYDFRQRHWEYHKPGRRDPERYAQNDEIMIDSDWKIGWDPASGPITEIAAKDFQDYMHKSMGIFLDLTAEDGTKVLWLKVCQSVEKGFVIETEKDHVTLIASEDKMTFRGTIHLEDIMNLEGAPVLKTGTMIRKPMYETRSVHSGSRIDYFPDQELLSLLHAGYNSIELYVEGIDRNHTGYCDFREIMDRAARFGITSEFHNYVQTYVHPEEEGAQEKFDKVYGELIKHYPRLNIIRLCGECLEFPSKDPATTGKRRKESAVDGIPDTRPSPGWHPCKDYPAYLQCIERAVHKFNPDAKVFFSTYNWGYAPLELRRKFLETFPKNVGLTVCYEIFSQRKLEGYHTPVMDYTISADQPGYYFESECAAAAEFGIPLAGNVNTAGIAWDFGCVPLVPAPGKLLKRNLYLREAYRKWGMKDHYVTHHYGWWNSVAADLGKWTGWEDFEPDYEELLKKIAVRDYGKQAAPHILEAWDCWSRGMDHYVASNEDQYGPWRTGAAYPFVFQPNISRTMMTKEIVFPTAKHAHFGSGIIKTFYTPYENSEQSPGFLRYPAELRSLQKMLDLWNKGLTAAIRAIEFADPEKKEEARRLEALGHFIRNSIITTMNIKKWWQLNIAMQASSSAEEAEACLDKIEALAYDEIRNAEDTIPAVEFDSRLGWEPSMEYVCDKWHLEWKIRQVKSALTEIAAYRKSLHLHEQ